MGPRPHLSFCAWKTTRLASELLDSMGPTTHLWFLQAKQRLLDRNYKSLWVSDFPKIFRIQNSAFSTKISSLYGSQTSPVVLCLQNRVISTWNTSPHGSQTSHVVLCLQNNVISIRITSLYGCQPSSVVFASKTANFGSELQVSMGLWLPKDFSHSKLRLLQQNLKSLWVPALICGFCIHNSVIVTRITSLSGSQTMSVILCAQNRVICMRITSLHGS